jgi:1-acyl-sn-glycerol-3-phosphate acyltransferase
LYAAIRLIISPLARLIFRPTIEGRDNVPKHGGVIIASNHLSFIDSVLIPIVAPRPVVFIAKKEYWTGTGIKGALSRAWFTAMQSIPIERDTHGAAQASLDAALSVLKNGQAFGIYPEGTRSRDGRLYRGKTGVGWLALTAQVPVVPCAVIGTDKLLPIGAKFPRFADVRVRFGTPLTFPPPGTGTTAAQARRAATDEVMAAIAAMSPQELAGVYNIAPQSS